MKCAKSTCAWRPAGVSKRTSKGATMGGLTARRKSFVTRTELFEFCADTVRYDSLSQSVS